MNDDCPKVRPFKVNPPRRGRDEGTTWEIDCPFCFRVHTHGAGIGARVPHCSGPLASFTTSYVLVEPDGTPDTVDRKAAAKARRRAERAVVARDRPQRSPAMAERLAREAEEAIAAVAAFFPRPS